MILNTPGGLGRVIITMPGLLGSGSKYTRGLDSVIITIPE